MSAELFIASARTLKGARWRHRGRKPWAVDCIGLIVLAGQRSGLQIDDEKLYGREPWDDQLRSGLRKRWGEPVSNYQPGDVALIRWKQGDPSHVAIVGDHPDGGLTLIHAHNLHGVVECSLSGPFVECVLEAYRPWVSHVN